MREARLIPPNACAVVHCSNRVSGELRKLASDEIAQLRDIIFRVFDYSGIEVMAYAVVPTGYDAMLRIGKARPLSDGELAERVARLYGEESVELVRLLRSLERFGRRTPEGRRLRAAHQQRMQNLSAAVRNIQQRFTFYLRARREGRSDKVWKDRFRCLPVEERGEVLAEVAAGVDAVPRWEEPAKAPERYPHCGFGEASAGNREWQRRICALTGCGRWPAARDAHRRAVADAVKPRRTWGMPRAHGNVPVARLASAAKRRAARSGVPRGEKIETSQWLAELRAFKKVHGHCSVPGSSASENSRLGQWLMRMQMKKERGTLPTRLRDRLESLGVTWEQRKRGRRPGTSSGPGSRWFAHYEKLADYKKCHGHCRVPRTFKGDKTFASWVWRQRMAKRAGSLSAEREKLLDALDFDWQLR